MARGLAAGKPFETEVRLPVLTGNIAGSCCAPLRGETSAETSSNGMEQAATSKI